MAREWSAGEGTDLADALAPFAERLTDLIKPVFYNLRHTVLPRGLTPRTPRSGAKRNIEAHYDLSNEMFRQFLDPTLSYSSALFDSLDDPRRARRPRARPAAQGRRDPRLGRRHRGSRRAGDRHRLGHPRHPGRPARRDRDHA